MPTAAKAQNITPDQKSFGARIRMLPSRRVRSHRPIKSTSVWFVKQRTEDGEQS
jgi:hypothetical protein